MAFNFLFNGLKSPDSVSMDPLSSSAGRVPNYKANIQGKPMKVSPLSLVSQDNSNENLRILGSQMLNSGISMVDNFSNGFGNSYQNAMKKFNNQLGPLDNLNQDQFQSKQDLFGSQYAKLGGNKGIFGMNSFSFDKGGEYQDNANMYNFLAQEEPDDAEFFNSQAYTNSQKFLAFQQQSSLNDTRETLEDMMKKFQNTSINNQSNEEITPYVPQDWTKKSTTSNTTYQPTYAPDLNVGFNAHGLDKYGSAYTGLDPKVTQATEEMLGKFPNLRLTSGKRSWGDKDAHPKGRAVDLSYDPKAYDYYANTVVPKYGFNKALTPNHGTGPHIHLGYYKKGGEIPYQEGFFPYNAPINYNDIYRIKSGFDSSMANRNPQYVPNIIQQLQGIIQQNPTGDLANQARMQISSMVNGLSTGQRLSKQPFEIPNNFSLPINSTYTQKPLLNRFDNGGQVFPRTNKDSGYKFREGGITNSPIYVTDPNDKRLRSYKKGGYLPPTTQDSLDLMNNSNQVYNYYKSKNYEGLDSQYKIFDSNLSFKDLNNSLNKFRENIKNGTLNIEYPTSTSKVAFGALPESYYYQKIDDNKFKQRETASAILDTRAPMSLFDKRMPPNYYYSLNNQNKEDALYNDAVNLFSYDPILIKPAAMKTKADWNYVKENFPESYKKPVQPVELRTNQPLPKPDISKGNFQGYTAVDGKVIPYYTNPPHTIQKMSSLQPQNYNPSSNPSMQGQPLTGLNLVTHLPEQKGKPIYGPGSTIIGYSGNDMKFNPAYQYTGAPNNQFNLQDKELLNNPDLLKQYIQNRDSGYKFKYGGIHINPANKGKFNALKARTGKSTEELTHSKNPLTRKRAVFALNSLKFKH